MNTSSAPQPATDIDFAARARDFYLRYHTGDPEAVGEILSPHWRNHPRRADEPEGPAGFKQVITGLTGAFPDLTFTIEDVLQDGNKVTVRALGQGTHTGTAFGPPTGNTVQFRTLDVHEFDTHGMIINTWHAEDVFGLLSQMSVVPNVYGARLDPYPGWH